MRASQRLHLASLIVAGWYLLLIVLHYFNQRPLWNDEYCVFANIHDQPLDRLFAGPLSHLQQFPRVYLYLIGQWSSHFDFHLLALRFFPFVCMTAAFIIWLNLAKKQIQSQWGLLTFVACWAASSKLVYYSAELKQYSMDVLAASAFLLFLFHQSEIQQKSKGLLAALLVLLPLFGLFSYPVFFFLPLIAYNIWIDSRSNIELRWWLGLYAAVCLSVFGIVYYFDIRISQASWLATSTDWNDHMVSLSSLGEFFKTLGEGCDNITSRWFAEHPKWLRQAARVFMALGFWRLLLGFWSAFKKDGFRLVSVRSIGFIVFAEHLILSVFKKYPFAVPRTSLFFAPILLFLTADALDWLKRKNTVLHAAVQYPFLIYLGYVSLGLARNILAGDLGADPGIWQ